MPQGPAARIASVGSALPGRVVPNAYFESLLDTSDEWIRGRTGIRERRWAEPGQGTVALAAQAAAAALERAHLAPERVDLTVFATWTPDRWVPPASAALAGALGLSGWGFDLNGGCSGWVYALQVATAQIHAGAAERVLVVGSDVMSPFLNLTDRTTAILFGDGAGAAVLERAHEPGVIASVTGTDGSMAEQITVPGGGSREPATAGTIAAHRVTVHMPDGQTVFKRAVRSMADSCATVLEKSGFSVADVDAVVAHQANARIIRAVAARLGLAENVVWVDVAEVGNTSSASIPLALDRGWRGGRLRPGDLVLTTAFGAGFTWGANLIRWTAPMPGDATT